LRDPMVTKILFVCLGNICRSPLAEGIMLHLVKQHGLSIQVDSAGTANYHIGEAPDRRTIQNAMNHGVNLTSLRARQFVKEDFESFDHIYVMDQNNYKTVLALCSSAEYKTKVDLFLNITSSGEQSEVPDPYYGSEKDFEKVFQLVYKTCEKLCFNLKSV
jgi:protein-tyrosine phosphatase